MKIALLCIGRTRDALLDQAIGRYSQRIAHYIGFQFVALPDLKAGSKLTEQAQKEREGRQILSWLDNSDYVVLLDERGRQLTSREFAAEIDRRALQGLKRVVFVVGGPYGFSSDVYQRANSRLSLSRMTFSHEMVRLFFTEQIYRACTILKGEPYHHD